MTNLRRRSPILQILAVAVFLGTTVSIEATTIRAVSVKELVTESQLIIDASVLALETTASANSDAIHTLVTFQVHEVLKGSHSGTTLQVSFLGGVRDGSELTILGMVYPEIDERGVYFLEDPTRALVNPIYGWGQGHFIVDDPSAGDASTVFTASFNAVFGVTDKSAASAQSTGRAATGIMTRPPDSTTTQMTLGAFKSALRAMISKSTGSVTAADLREPRKGAQ